MPPRCDNLIIEASCSTMRDREVMQVPVDTPRERACRHCSEARQGHWSQTDLSQTLSETVVLCHRTGEGGWAGHWLAPAGGLGGARVTAVSRDAAACRGEGRAEPAGSEDAGDAAGRAGECPPAGAGGGGVGKVGTGRPGPKIFGSPEGASDKVPICTPQLAACGATLFADVGVLAPATGAKGPGSSSPIAPSLPPPAPAAPAALPGRPALANAAAVKRKGRRKKKGGGGGAKAAAPAAGEDGTPADRGGGWGGAL